MLGRSVGSQLLFLWCCGMLVLAVEAVGMKRSRSKSPGRPAMKAVKPKPAAGSESPVAKAGGGKAAAKAGGGNTGSVRTRFKPRKDKSAAELANRVRAHAYGIRERRILTGRCGRLSTKSRMCVTTLAPGWHVVKTSRRLWILTTSSS
jgi:hypothetical protein